MPKNKARVHGTLPTEDPVTYQGLAAETIDPLGLPPTRTFEELNHDVGTVSGGPDHRRPVS